MNSKSTILTCGSEIIASKCLERPPSPQKRENVNIVSEVKNFTERLAQICFCQTFLVKVNGQSIYSVSRKKQRNVFQSSVPERSSVHHLYRFVHLIHFPPRLSLPRTVQGLIVNIWIFFISVYETGLLTIFGLSGWWLFSTHVHHEWMKHLRHLDRTISSPATVFWRKISSYI